MYGQSIEPNLFNRPGIARLNRTVEGLAAIGLLMSMRSWSFNSYADGFVPDWALSQITYLDSTTTLELVDALVRGHQIAVVDGGWQILEWKQKSAKEIWDQATRDHATYEHNKKHNHALCGDYPGWKHEKPTLDEWRKTHPSWEIERDQYLQSRITSWYATRDTLGLSPKGYHEVSVRIPSPSPLPESHRGKRDGEQVEKGGPASPPLFLPKHEGAPKNPKHEGAQSDRSHPDSAPPTSAPSKALRPTEHF